MTAFPDVRNRSEPSAAAGTDAARGFPSPTGEGGNPVGPEGRVPGPAARAAPETRSRGRESDPHTSSPPALDADLIAALADAVAERVLERLGSLAPQSAPVSLLTTAEAAQRLGVSADWVRRHSRELGVVKLGQGARPRLRFDPERVAAALTAREAGEGSPTRAVPTAERNRRPRRRRRSGTAPELLPIRGEGPGA